MLSGKELFEAQQTDARRRYKITMRFYDGLDETFQFLYKSRTFKIDSVNDIMEMEEKHVVTCIEDSTNGAN